MDARDRHREGHPELRVELTEGEDVGAALEDDLLDASRSVEAKAVTAGLAHGARLLQERGSRPDPHSRTARSFAQTFSAWARKGLLFMASSGSASPPTVSPPPTSTRVRPRRMYLSGPSRTRSLRVAGLTSLAQLSW